MTSDKIHDTGEEYLAKNGGDGDTFTIGLFSSEDKLTDSDDIGAITTEPNSSDYSRVSATLSAVDHPAAFTDVWGLENPNDISIPVGDSDNIIDSYFVAKDFLSEDKGDGSSQLHLISTGFLHKSPVNLDDGFEDIINITLPAGLIGLRLGPKIEGDVFHAVGTNKFAFAGGSGWSQSTVSTPFDVTSGWQSQTTFSETSYSTIEFDITGYRMLLSLADSSEIQQYILDNRYDLSNVELDTTITGDTKIGDTNVRSLGWKYDGTVLYDIGDDDVVQHDVSRPFDISTVTSSTSTGFNPNDTITTGSTWNDDGSRWYLTSYGINNNITGYEVTTPWDLSTANQIYNINKAHTLSVLGTNPPVDIAFNHDGTIFYVADGGETDSSTNLVQHQLDTPFDLRTNSSDGSSDNLNVGHTGGFTLNNHPKYNYEN